MSFSILRLDLPYKKSWGESCFEDAVSFEVEVVEEIENDPRTGRFRFIVPFEGEYDRKGIRPMHRVSKTPIRFLSQLREFPFPSSHHKRIEKQIWRMP